MNKIKQTLIYFLSNPTISEKDFIELFKYLENGGFEEIAVKVKEIRKITKTETDFGPILFTSNFSKNENPESYSFDNDRLKEIERLLFIEANLSKKEAMKLLAKYLKIQFNQNQHIGFNKWVEKISKQLSWSEILHVAHLIRNEKVHDENNNPWPLRKLNDEY